MGENVKTWCKAAAVRAVKTAAQNALSVIPVSAMVIGEVDPAMVAGAAALGFVYSILTSLAGIPEVADGASVKRLIKSDSE